MKAGKIIRSFVARDGRKVLLRTLRWEDLDDLLTVVNSLVEEKADIIRTERVSRKEEIDWISGALARLEKEEVIYVVAEVDGKAISNSELRRLSGHQKHVGVIGIAIEKGFRDIGIGTEMMKVLIEQARALDLTVLTLTVFASNQKAVHVYEKVGFEKTGSIPKKIFKNRRYVDELIMTKLLK